MSASIRKAAEVPLNIVEEAKPFGIDTPEMRLARKIYMARCRLRWSQEEVAIASSSFKVVNLSQQRISRIEKGLAVVEFLELAAIAKALGCPLAEFEI